MDKKLLTSPLTLEVRAEVAWEETPTGLKMAGIKVLDTIVIAQAAAELMQTEAPVGVTLH